MIQSMTGYGSFSLQLDTKKVTIEIKTLNSKNIDLSVRIPSYYKEKEIYIRKMLTSQLIRGKVDFSIYIEDTSGVTSSKINEKVVLSYIKDLRKISLDENLLEIAMRLPDALKVEKEDLDPQEWQKIEDGIVEALKSTVVYRKEEALALGDDFKERITNIEQQLSMVEQMSPKRIEAVKTRLSNALDELKQSVDTNKYEQELIYYLEKLDINEEIVRLKTHLDYFIKELATDESNGKKLGFILQEMGREINTIGSKSNFAEMQRSVVQMKNELEKIKEQMLNVL
ncbi:MAG: YicC family protein [Flavobacteriaceae bacterium]|nr:YicC family protein [Flavobacteriaceae bacterium]